MVDSSFWLNLKVFQICLNNTYGLDPYPEIQKIVPGPGINHSGSTTLIESNHFPSCVLDLVKCPGGTGPEGLEQCYTNSGGDPGLPCSTECLGGCTGLLPTQCTACRNMRWTGEGCKEKFKNVWKLKYLTTVFFLNSIVKCQFCNIILKNSFLMKNFGLLS